MSPSLDLVRRLGLRHPIIQGPFGGGLSTVRLVAAAADAGGLGSYGAHLLAPEEILRLSSDIRAATPGPFALNLWVSNDDAPGRVLDPAEHADMCTRLAEAHAELGLPCPPLLTEPLPVAADFEAQADAVIAARPAVFSFVFGVPSSAILRACRDCGIITVGAATTVEEAVTLEAAGVDAVVATGFEAGGHRPSFMRAAEESLHGTLALVPRVAARVRIPVIAAGGIADARGVRSALALGAQAVQIGTAFLACEESGAGDAHRERLLAGEQAGDSRLTRAVTGRLARFLPNRLLECLEAGPNLPYPRPSWFTSPLKRAAIAQGRAEWIPLYAGQAAPLLRHRKAAELMTALCEGAAKR
ncbi:MAG: nitronate monooxygenase [Candidatus Didemnitutus sp.]|nr:nitronate monooxygenase [Candidatus Didemnitutus sp.]